MKYDIGSSNWGNYATIGLAVLGIALGGAGLYAGLSGRGVKRLHADRISELERRVGQLDGATEELNGQIRGLYSQTRTALQAVENRFAAIQGQGARPVAAAPAAAASDAPAGTAPARTHTIRPGDTLGKVAQSAGTSVAAILKVNPGLNPNRLRVGQIIQMP